MALYLYEEGSATTDPFDAASLYPLLLGKSIMLCRRYGLGEDTAEDWVQETYLRKGAKVDTTRSRGEQYTFLRNALRQLIRDVARRRPDVIQLWPSAGDESWDDLGERGL